MEKQIQSPEPAKRLLTIKETCLFLEIRMSKCRDLVFRNQIPVLRIGRLLRFDPVDLQKWLEEKKNYKLN
jgi:excisionase family DNA binding protein